MRELILPLVRDLYGLLNERIDAGPTVIAAPGTAFGARLVHEKRGTPLVTIHLQPAVLRSLIDTPILPFTLMGPGMPRWFKRLQYWAADTRTIDRMLGPQLNAFRAELGLPPVRGIMRDWWNSPQCVIGLFPPWFAPPQADWPKQVRLTSFPLWDERGVTALPPGLEAFLAAGSPPIVFTPGSAMLHGHAFFEAALDACRRLDRRGLFLTRYPEQLPAQLPSDVAHFDWAPFSQVLPSCAAIVHHGGVGTSAQGLAAGIPHLVMPMSHDQPDNAARLTRLGVGRGIQPKRFRGPEVARQLSQLIERPEVKQRCQELAVRLDFQAGLEQTCLELEALAASHTSSRDAPPMPTLNRAD